MKLAGSLTVGSSLPSFRYRSGMNFSGSGYVSGSCIMDLPPDSRRKHSRPTCRPEQNGPCVHNDDRVCRYEEAVIRIVSCAVVRYEERRGVVPPQSFFEDGVDVGQAVAVGETWEPRLSHHGIQLCLRLLLYLWRERHCHKEGTECRMGLAAMWLCRLPNILMC